LKSSRAFPADLRRPNAMGNLGICVVGRRRYPGLETDLWVALCYRDGVSEGETRAGQMRIWKAACRRLRKNRDRERLVNGQPKTKVRYLLQNAGSGLA
jgi:hypothetical protein